MVKHTQVSALRAARTAAVTAAVTAIATQVRTQQRNARKQQAYMLAVQQVAARYGMQVPNTLSVRATGARAQQHAPSSTGGACKQVHAIAAANNYNRANTLAACKAAGINPATAATQYALAKRAAQVQ